MLDLPVEDLGHLDYAAAYQRQCDTHAHVLAARASFESQPDSTAWPHLPGRLLLVEHHPPVITVSNRPTAPSHLIASAEQLQRLGVTVAATDRGGDITYHGPGQLVAYPILDLNVLRLRLHDYLRLLESVVIDLLASLDIPAHRDAAATGVWVPSPQTSREPIFKSQTVVTPSQREGEGGGLASVTAAMPLTAQDATSSLPESAKICAMGVRVRQWVTLHGLALNVTTNLAHFDLIVPCGLAGRAVTSIERDYAARFPGESPGSARPFPTMPHMKSLLATTLAHHLNAHLDARLERESNAARERGSYGH